MIAEFRTSIKGGAISLPENVRRAVCDGEHIIVRLCTDDARRGLDDVGATEEEVDRISAVQMESREQVVMFLASEGRLSRHAAFRRRVRARA